MFSTESYQQLNDKCNFTTGVDGSPQPQDVGKDASRAFRQTGHMRSRRACARNLQDRVRRTHKQYLGPQSDRMYRERLT